MSSVMLGFIFVITLSNLLAPVVNGQLFSNESIIFCGNRANYTDGDTYQSNYNSLLIALNEKVDQSGFYSTSVGEEPNTIYGFILCVGDLELEYCRSNCIQSLINDFAESCQPYDTEAVGLNPACMFGYSDRNNFRAPFNLPAIYHASGRDASSPDQYTKDVNITLHDLIVNASRGNSLHKVAAESKVTADYQTIYAMVQCTPDLTLNDCTICLNRGVLIMNDCCIGRAAARIAMIGCFINYQPSLFYNATMLTNLALTFFEHGTAATTPVLTAPVGLSPPLVPSPATPPPGAGHWGRRRNNKKVIITPVSIFAGVIIISIIFIAILLIRKRRKKAPKKESETETTEISTVESLQYDFERIRAATDGFSEANKLGEGGFGPVYKGQLSDGKEIAVKKLSHSSHQGDLEFKNEAMLLVKLQHRNLVRLLGFALHGTERLLVYEYLQNSSLEHYIFDRTKQARLDWDLCYKIIRGISRGIQYLHEDSRHRIVHRDLKPSNVLLDANMNPKIADFGIARLVMQQDVSHFSTLKIVGTYGYMAPEYVIHGQFSMKSDVFSFGVLVLEIVSGRRNSNSGTPGSAGNLLISTVWKNWIGGTPANMINPAFLINSSVPENILRCIQIGLLCVQENPTERPTMASIVLMLSGDTVTLPVPSPPGYYLPREFILESHDS